MSSEILDQTIFKNKTVLITGHTGFIGTWLSVWLHSLGAKVIGYSLKPPTIPSMFKTVRLKDDIIHILGDVRDSKKLHNCIRSNDPDFVFHMAAQPIVRDSYQKPIETLQINIIGTANLLDGIRDSKVKVCIVMTSDKCYENHETNRPFKETDPMGGYDPYSASKGAAELITASFRNSYFSSQHTGKQKVGIATVRAGNVIGGGDWAKDRVVPDCIRALISKKSIFLRHPSAIRPWQHVLEPISGMLCLATKMWKNPSKYSQAWNFGPIYLRNKTTVKWIVNQIINQWDGGKSIKISKEEVTSLHEAKILLLDSRKAMKELGWHPVYSAYDAVKETVSWYKAFADKTFNMKEFTLLQIQNYVKRAKQMNITWTRS